MNAPRGQEHIEDGTSVLACLEMACSNLGKRNTPQIARFERVLVSDNWYRTAGELRLAIKDGDAWRELGLPGMLKLELKRLLKPRHDPINCGRWTKMFDEASDSWYYYGKNDAISCDDTLGSRLRARALTSPMRVGATLCGQIM